MAELVVGIIGAGTMGAGIAQVAAAAGHAVLLYDVRPDAPARAREQMAAHMSKRVSEHKMPPGERDRVLGRIAPATVLESLASCGLIIEAIVEDLDVKRALFARLECIVSASCVLASNTSSLSITALARGLRAPGRLVGLHFFNPAPAMKLVEVVRGLQTEEEIALLMEQRMRDWGKTPVAARSAPGFIVNRIARPFYGEALWLLQERRATPAQIDACLRGAGFRMGPCELMDLIGHDVNYAVTASIFAANHGDRRYMPSQLQRELIDAGRLGRKSGRGFYDYGAESRSTEEAAPGAASGAVRCILHGSGPNAEALTAFMSAADIACERRPDSSMLRLGFEAADGAAIHLACTDGRTAAQLAAEQGSANWGVFDWLPQRSRPGALATAFAAACPASSRAVALSAFCRLGMTPIVIADAPGLVVARTLAMLVNEAADAVQQGVCDPVSADTAIKLGVNYPAGPFEWLTLFGSARVIELLQRLQVNTDSERYRVSPWLWERQWNETQSRAS